MGHLTQVKELLEKQQTCKHQHVAFITEERKYIPKGYAWLQRQDDFDLEYLTTIEWIDKNVCFDCGLQLD